MKTLKPCPHCGGKANTYPVDPESYDEYEAATVCTYCGASTPGYGKTQEEANKDAETVWELRFNNEPTCKWEAVTNPYGEITEYMCECGRCMGVVPKYCPSCGTEVERVD